MTSELPSSVSRKGRLSAEVRAQLRDVTSQISLLNHHVGDQLEIRAVDFECLDLVGRHGPLSPSALARLAGLHPATMTGVLDRLERGGWIMRERDAADRRAVRIRVVAERGARILGLYAGMNGSMARILAGYDEAELEVLADFLRRTAEAGRAAADELAAKTKS
jgi:DNA-binding MarR family transcriptional regulator